MGNDWNRVGPSKNKLDIQVGVGDTLQKSMCDRQEQKTSQLA